MNNLDENLSELFDVMPMEVPEVPAAPPKQEVLPAVIDDDNIESDYLTARTNIKSLIQKGDTAIEGILRVAEQSDHPRAYEVAATFIKTLADLNKDLLELQKQKKELTGAVQTTNNQTNIDKAVFIGSTAELIKMIKNKEE